MCKDKCFNKAAVSGMCDLSFVGTYDIINLLITYFVFSAFAWEECGIAQRITAQVSLLIRKFDSHVKEIRITY